MPRKSNPFKLKKGALRKQLGIPSGKHIPPALERDILDARVGTHIRGHTVTALLKRRVNFAVNAREWRK